MGDSYLPVSDFITPEEIGDPHLLDIELQVGHNIMK
jgi:hypothetical protein